MAGERSPIVGVRSRRLRGLPPEQAADPCVRRHAEHDGTVGVAVRARVQLAAAAAPQVPADAMQPFDATGQHRPAWPVEGSDGPEGVGGGHGGWSVVRPRRRWRRSSLPAPVTSPFPRALCLTPVRSAGARAREAVEGRAGSTSPGRFALLAVHGDDVGRRSGGRRSWDQASPQRLQSTGRTCVGGRQAGGARKRPSSKPEGWIRAPRTTAEWEAKAARDAARRASGEVRRSGRKSNLPNRFGEERARSPKPGVAGGMVAGASKGAGARTRRSRAAADMPVSPLAGG